MESKAWDLPGMGRGNVSFINVHIHDYNITVITVKITICSNLIGSFNTIFLNLTAISFIGKFPIKKVMLLDTCYGTVE